HAMIGNLPPRRSTWEDPALASDDLARAFRDQLERVEPTPQVLEWERIAQELRLATERVVRGRETQDEAMRKLDAKVDDILAKRRWVRAQGIAPALPPRPGVPAATAPAPGATE